ncbi:MAG: hypothetical protein HYT21_01910 [Candidatus Nealsonbacteria bacterium]|nr:hypothetical protein [Candidatus Nealsonbacteria bacterium]
MGNPIPVPPKKKNTWFGKIQTRDEAIKVIKDASNGFYFLAALQIVLGYFIMRPEAIIDGAIFAICAFLLRKFNSRVVAIILLLLSIGGLIVTGMNNFGGGAGGQNLILAVIMIWVSIRAIQATFGLRRFQSL